jgi:hypothetical protein
VPVIRTPNEDFHHILRCSHTSQEKWRTDFRQTLQEKCYSLKTSPPLVEILLGGLTSWLLAEPFDESDFPIEYCTLLQEQRTIGFRAEYHQNGPSFNRSITMVTLPLKVVTGPPGLAIFYAISSRSGFSYGTPEIPTDTDATLLRRIWLAKIRLSANLMLFTPSKSQCYTAIDQSSSTISKTITKNQPTPYGSGSIPTNHSF